MDWGEIDVDANGTFEEGPVHIMDSWDQGLRRKTVRLVKVLWQHHTVEWRRQLGRARIRCGPPIPSYLGMKVRSLVI